MNGWNDAVAYHDDHAGLSDKRDRRAAMFAVYDCNAATLSFRQLYLL